jgi:peptide chain release factor 1
VKSAQDLLQKLAAIADRFTEVEKSVGDPDVISNQKRYTELMREYRRLEPMVALYKALDGALKESAEAKIWMAGDDSEMAEMAKEEWPTLEQSIDELVADGRIMLLPRDVADDRPVMLELRAGTGGDEAAIFAGDLFRMYGRFADSRGWKMELLSANEGTAGGFKEAICRIDGDGVFGIMKFESGVHRVQRVPDTESQGRVHTSAATVAVMPVAEAVDVELKMTDVRRDTFRASGAGGQHVNKTESAIRLTHIPSGIVVECQDGRSQHQNLERATEVLRSRLYEAERARLHAKEAAHRKTLVSSGDRSAKIRTYNFPQGRVTDHRIGLTLHALPAVLNGQIDDIIDALILAEQSELLKNA